MATTLARPALTREDIERQAQDIVDKKAGKLPTDNTDLVGLTSQGYFDTDIYGSSKSKFEGYEISIPTNEAEEDDDDYSAGALGQPKRATYTAPAALLNDIPQGEQYNAFAEHKQPTIAEREDEYRARRRKMIISPDRHDPFAEVRLLR